MEALKGFVFIQLLNCSQPKGIAQVDAICKVVILRSYFAGVRGLGCGRCWGSEHDPGKVDPLSPEVKC